MVSVNPYKHHGTFVVVILQMEKLRLARTIASWGQEQDFNMCPQSFHHIMWLQLNETNKARGKEEVGTLGFAASMKMSV